MCTLAEMHPNCNYSLTLKIPNHALIDHELIKPKNQKRERDRTGMRGSQHPRSLMSTDHQINISLSTSAKSETRRIEIALQQNRQISYSSELALSSAVACTKGQSAPFMHLPASKNLHGYLGFRLYACSSEVAGASVPESGCRNLQSLPYGQFPVEVNRSHTCPLHFGHLLGSCSRPFFL